MSRDVKNRSSPQTKATKCNLIENLLNKASIRRSTMPRAVALTVRKGGVYILVIKSSDCHPILHI